MKPDVVGEILLKIAVKFWVASGKEWCGQHLTSKEMEEHEGFKLCLKEIVISSRQNLWEAVEKVVPEMRWCECIGNCQHEDEIEGHNACRKETLKWLKRLILGNEDDK